MSQLVECCEMENNVTEHAAVFLFHFLLFINKRGAHSVPNKRGAITFTLNLFLPGSLGSFPEDCFATIFPSSRGLSTI